MSSLAQVIFFSLIGGVGSLIGGFILLSNKKRAGLLAEYATPLAAGALLAAAFVDLLPEAAHAGDIDKALIFTLAGILIFFLLERFLHWFHHHHEHQDKQTDPTISLIIIGDTLHNFIDGIAIAAGFLVSPPTGIVVTLAVAAHEIPQEIGDFGLLLHKGMERKKVIWANMLSALATTAAAIIFFQLGQSVEIPFDMVLGLVAGFFIYIAASDIIPSIHRSEVKQLARWQSLILVVGAVVVSFITVNLHTYIDQGLDNEAGQTSRPETEYSGDGLYEYDNNETLPTLEAQLEADPTAGWNLKLNTTNFVFTPQSVNQPNIPGEGHAHLYINDEEIARLYSPYFHIDKLQDGDEIRVVLNANDHSEYVHDNETIEALLIVNYGGDDSSGQYND